MEFYNRGSHLKIITGPMFSGKTSLLISHVKKFDIININYIMIGHSKDNRYTENPSIVTHDKVAEDKMCIKCSKLEEADKLITKDIYAILIDEGQFFVDLVKYVKKWLREDKYIVVSGLVSDYLMRPFGDMCNLVAISDSVIKLKAICEKCHQDAYHTKRIVSNNDVELIGSKDLYIPVCRKCFFK